MDVNYYSQDVFYLAQNARECRQLFFQLHYLGLRELFVHGFMLLMTGFIYRI